MSARTKERKRALDILYAAEARGLDPLEVLAERRAAVEAEPGTVALGEYAQALVTGVVDHQFRIDQLIAQHAIGWTLERMPAVDRAILRIAVQELVYVDGLDAAVAVDEAVELAKRLSTDDSPRFINGVLSSIVAIVDQLRAAS